MKKSELQRIIKEETRKALREGDLATYLDPEQVTSLKTVVTKIVELQAAVKESVKIIHHKDIERMLLGSYGTPEIEQFRQKLVNGIYQLRDLRESETIKEEETAVFKVNDVVVPKVGPMKGVEHKVIAVVSELDGTLKYNIQPIIRPGQRNLYRLGAAAAKASEIFKPQTEPRI
jgi:hypothetical protein